MAQLEPNYYRIYEVEVLAQSGRWTGEHVKFATIESAREYGHHLGLRAGGSRKWRVVDNDGNVVVESSL